MAIISKVEDTEIETLDISIAIRKKDEQQDRFLEVAVQLTARKIAEIKKELEIK